MKLILISIIILLVSQSVKFLIFLFRGGRVTAKSFLWHYLWVGKFPSTHSAVLSGVLYTLWREEGFSQLFGFCAIVSSIVLYTLVENKKRYTLLESYYIKSNDDALKSLVRENKLNEFEGHTFTEVVTGLLLGLVVALLLNFYM